MRTQVLIFLACFAAVGPARASESLAGLSDPTRPWAGRGADVSPAAGRAGGPVLQSTLVAPGAKRAVIDGRGYAVGDKFGAAVITDIRPYEVVLTQSGRAWRLRLLPELTKDHAR